MIVTALVPSESAASPVVKCERLVSADRAGLVVELSDGLKVTCVAAQEAGPLALAPLSIPAHALVMVEKPGGRGNGG